MISVEQMNILYGMQWKGGWQGFSSNVAAAFVADEKFLPR